MIVRIADRRGRPIDARQLLGHVAARGGAERAATTHVERGIDMSTERITGIET